MHGHGLRYLSHQLSPARTLCTMAQLPFSRLLPRTTQPWRRTEIVASRVARANDRLHQGHQPLREERASAKLFLDLHTVLAPSGEERTLGGSRRGRTR
jgi:hypothetical protein